MSFGEILRKIRETRGTLRGVAQTLDLDPGYLSRLENDKYTFNPSRDFIHKIAEKLECSDEEKNQLLAEAGRLDKDMEDIARDATTNPRLQTLFRSLPDLDDAQLKIINKKIEQLRAKKENKSD